MPRCSNPLPPPGPVAAGAPRHRRKLGLRPRGAPLTGLVLALALAVLHPGRASAVFDWSPEGYIDPAAGEGQKAQIALDDAGRPIAVWAGRLTANDPWAILYSVFDGSTWSLAVAAFAPGTADEELPVLSRGRDGSLWLAFERNQAGVFGPSLSSALMAARFTSGAWALPETVSVDLAAPDPTFLEVSLAAVDRDSAWVAYLKPLNLDPLSGYSQRDLFTGVRSAAGWSADQPVPNSGLDEDRPALALSRGSQPIVIFGFRGVPTLLSALRWNGVAWAPGQGDTLVAEGFFEHAAAPDTNGALRVAMMLRDSTGGTREDRIQEYEWNATGFHAGLIIDFEPAPPPGGTEVPDWRGLSIALWGGSCPTCGPAPLPRYRVFWADFSQPSAPIVISSARDQGGYRPFDSPGEALQPGDAFPNGAHDPVLDRWYAVWTGPPGQIAKNRAKFAFTLEFVGEVGVGANLVPPDTARVSVVASGDATGRTFRIFRLRWDDVATSPPPPNPIPPAAVEIAASPKLGPCPFAVDDRPGAGRYFYYVHLEAAGPLAPEDFARSNAFALSDTGGGGGGPRVSALRSPRPRPAVDAVSLPFDLARAGDVSLAIYDPRGRFVRNFRIGALAAGSYVGAIAPVWDGTDEGGRRVPSGMYFVRLLVNGNPAGRAERVVMLFSR